MESNTLNEKVKTATKWSVITEVAAKLVAPLSTMVLARLLLPDAFGVLVMATMVIYFAEIFTDAGFQKYIIQNEFSSDEDLYRSTNVAFWSNLGLSILIWIVIAIFSSDIAHLAGSDGYGLVVAVSCVCIPLAAFSSIQMALMKRLFAFKSLFVVRIAGILVPIVVTIPIAYFTGSYWSLIIGMIARECVNAVVLTWVSPFKPRLTYQYSLFKSMFSFTFWSMLESVSIWLTSYLDIFIVGTILNTYYLGVYRTSMNIVSQIMFVVTASTTPILFSALSRLQNNQEEFKGLFMNFQRMVALLVIPMGAGIFLFSDPITEILLGPQWYEASNFIGWWGLSGAVVIIFSHYASEIYRSLGKPKVSVLAQLLHLVCLIPVVYISIGYGFETLVMCRSLVRLQMILVNAVILWMIVRMSLWKMLYNCRYIFFSTAVMALVYYLLPRTGKMVWDIMQMSLCAIVYLAVLCGFPRERAALVQLVQGFVGKMNRRKS